MIKWSARHKVHRTFTGTCTRSKGEEGGEGVWEREFDSTVHFCLPGGMWELYATSSSKLRLPYSESEIRWCEMMMEEDQDVVDVVKHV